MSIIRICQGIIWECFNDYFRNNQYSRNTWFRKRIREIHILFTDFLLYISFLRLYIYIHIHIYVILIIIFTVKKYRSISSISIVQITDCGKMTTWTNFLTKLVAILLEFIADSAQNFSRILSIGYFISSWKFVARSWSKII